MKKRKTCGISTPITYKVKNFATMIIMQFYWIKINFVPHCPETLRYAKVWGRNIVRSLTLAYAKRLFPDSNP